MYRCIQITTAVLALAGAVPAAQAQMQRPFPADALRGDMRFGQPPEVTLNGQPARLSPGTRIRNQNNMLEMSGALIGQRALVHYTIDTSGNVRDVWILTEAERAKRPWPVTPKQALEWLYDPQTQTWSRP